MKLAEAMLMIAANACDAEGLPKHRPGFKGYMVGFERIEGALLTSDHFPDKHAGEPLIKELGLAQKLMMLFADATYGSCVNIHILDEDFKPIDERLIPNR